MTKHKDIRERKKPEYWLMFLNLEYNSGDLAIYDEELISRTVRFLVVVFSIQN